MRPIFLSASARRMRMLRAVASFFLTILLHGAAIGMLSFATILFIRWSAQ